MEIKVVKGDIAKIEVGIVVNAAGPNLPGGFTAQSATRRPDCWTK